MRIICTILLLVASALAQCTGSPNCTVKAGGGGNYTTIQACATAMANGDTCTVFAGTYNENVTLSAGGVASYKTLQVNGADVVNVLSFTLNSHNRIISFHVTNPTAPGPPDAGANNCIMVSTSATDVFITGNTLTQCGGNQGAIYGSYSGSSFVYVQNNTISYACSSPALTTAECIAMTFYGDHWLIEGNDISHSSDAINYSGSNNVMRKNTLHDFSETECITSGLNPCHIDGFPSEPGAGSTQFNLIEANTMVNNLGPNSHFALAQGDACFSGTQNCHHLIIRYNVAAHVGSTGVLDNNAANSSVNPGFYHVKTYNNTWADLPNDATQQNSGITSSYLYHSTNGANINDLFYYTFTALKYTPIACANGVSDPNSTCSTFTERNNLAFSTGTITNLYGQVYEQGNWTDIASNLTSDPKVVNYSSSNLGDLHLKTGSPALATGSNLTTTVGTGSSSTALTVADAAFFQDGSGITGVQADWIRIGASTTVQISSVNYSTNVITLASPVSWSNGASVYLYKDSNGKVLLSGASPSIGSQQDAIAPAFSVVTPYSGVAVSVSLSTSSGSVICWTTNGTTPATDASTGCTTGTLYSSPIAINSTATLKAISGGTGYVDSGVTSGVYTITSATPTDMAVQGLTINRLTISQ